jgi:hypothetical protein
MEETIQLDKQGRMLYHPDFHFNHGKMFTEEDLEYLCKYWEVDHQRTLAYALGRPEKNLASTIWSLRKSGKYDYYKNLNKHW